MKGRRIDSESGRETFALIFDAAHEAVEELTRFARDHALSAAHFTGTGALSGAVLGCFD